MKEHTAEVEV